MAIQPEFSQAILAGTKLVEFRKRPLAPDVRLVMMYETAPTQRIVGLFNVSRTVEASPTALWSQFGHVGGISRRRFREYYEGSASAVGLVVGSAVPLSRPIRLSELEDRPAVPQSFVYLPGDALGDLLAKQGPKHRQFVAHVHRSLARVVCELKIPSVKVRDVRPHKVSVH